MRGAADFGLLNENSEWVADVLDSVNRLRQAYRAASSEEMEQCARELRSLLRDKSNGLALDRELKSRRVLARTLDDKVLLEREARLAERFGYSRRELKRFVGRARIAVADERVLPEIASMQQLVEHLDRLHGEAIAAMTANSRWWERRRKVRQASSSAQGRLFAVGAIVADASSRILFDLSYALAVAALHEDGP